MFKAIGTVLDEALIFTTLVVVMVIGLVAWLGYEFGFRLGQWAWSGWDCFGGWRGLLDWIMVLDAFVVFWIAVAILEDEDEG